MTEFLDLSIREMAQGLRAGRLTAEGLLDAIEDRHEAVGRRLNAYRTWDGQGARLQARAADAALAGGIDLGVLQGLPVSAKDIFGVAGLPIYAGSPRRLPPRFEVEGPVVRALRRGLAVITGKTHTVEFAFGALGTNPHGGSPWNPWDARVQRACGGSSCGAGVSLAWGAAVVALGSDTGGSIRNPASFTGTVGLKITLGRWSAEGIVPLSPTFDTPGPLTRSVEDAVMAFGVIDPRWNGDAEGLYRQVGGLDLAGVRLGLPEAMFWEDCGPGIAEAAKSAVDDLVARGASLVPVHLPEAAEAAQCFIDGQLFGVEGLPFLEDELPEWLDTMDPNVRDRMEPARRIDAITYYRQLRKLRRLSAQAAERMAEIDALVVPAMPITAPALSEIDTPESYQKLNGFAGRNNRPANMLGQCALSMPVALDPAGLPTGLMFIARPNQEERLLAVALAAERVLGTARQRLGRPPALATA